MLVRYVIKKMTSYLIIGVTKCLSDVVSTYHNANILVFLNNHHHRFHLSYFCFWVSAKATAEWQTGSKIPIFFFDLRNFFSVFWDFVSEFWDFYGILWFFLGFFWIFPLSVKTFLTCLLLEFCSFDFCESRDTTCSKHFFPLIFHRSLIT